MSNEYRLDRTHYSSLATRQKGANMLRVLLGSHEAGERHQWRQWLSEAPLEVVGLAQDGQEAVQLALQLRPDLVVLDQELPVLDGFQAAGMISLAAPGTMQVLVGPTD